MTARWMVRPPAERSRAHGRGTAPSSLRAGALRTSRGRTRGPLPPAHRCLSAAGPHGGGPQRPSPVPGLPAPDLGAHAARSYARPARGGDLRPTSPGGTDAVAFGVERIFSPRGRVVKWFLGLPVTPPRYPRRTW